MYYLSAWVSIEPRRKQLNLLNGNELFLNG
jgi:hypothetical protein